MSKWDEHKKKFKELNQSTGIGIKEYCAQNGLQYNTGRRYLKLSDQDDDHFAEEKRRLDAQGKEKKPARPAAREKKQPKKQSHASSDAEVITDQGEAQQSADHMINDQRGNGGDPISRPSSASLSTRFKRGVDYNYKHGLYATPKYQDIAGALEILMDPENIPLLEFEAIKSLTAQKMLIERMQNESLSRLVEADQRAAQGEKKGDDDDEEDPVPVEFKMLKIASDTGLSLAAVAGSISAIVDRSHVRNQKYRQLSLKEREANISREAYRKLESEEFSALEAAMFIESHAVKVPALLMKLVEKELEKMALNDAIQGVGNENLNEMALRYAETRKKYGAAIAGRAGFIEEFMQKQGYENGTEAVSVQAGDANEENTDRDIVKQLYGDE